jgi:predicted Zn finger-like uncharacterized protein
MTEELYTRCPGCKTIFRVTEPQLALRDGQVRCGHCRTVFNGREHLISLAPPAGGEPEYDELAQGPPTVTLRSARSLDPPPPPEPAPPATETETGTEREAEPEPAEADEVDYENRFAWDKRKPKRARSGFYAALVPILVLALVLQSVFHFRDAIAANWPGAKPVLTKACSIAGCAIRPLNDVDALTIDGSELQADPAHQGLLILTATLRNRARYAIAFPHLALSLTGVQAASGMVPTVARRVLAPTDYAGGTIDLAAGMPANREMQVKVFIDASSTTQEGYLLYAFYP